MVKIPSLRRRQAPNGHDPGPNQLSSIVKALESMQSQLDQMQHDLLHGDAGEMIRLNKRLDDMEESLRGQRDGEKDSNNDAGSPKWPQQLNRCSSSSQVSTINGELCNESSSLAVRCDPHPVQIDGERDDSHCDGDKPGFVLEFSNADVHQAATNNDGATANLALQSAEAMETPSTFTCNNSSRSEHNSHQTDSKESACAPPSLVSWSASASSSHRGNSPRQNVARSGSDAVGLESGMNVHVTINADLANNKSQRQTVQPHQEQPTPEPQQNQSPIQSHQQEQQEQPASPSHPLTNAIISQPSDLTHSTSGDSTGTATTATAQHQQQLIHNIFANWPSDPTVLPIYLWPVAMVPILCVVIMIMVVVLVGVVIGSYFE